MSDVEDNTEVEAVEEVRILLRQLLLLLLPGAKNTSPGCSFTAPLKKDR